MNARQALGALIGVMAAVVIVTLVWAVLAIRDTQTTNTGTIDLIKNCTEADGQCYKENQRRTAEAIQQLIDANQLNEVATRRVVLLTAACQERPDIAQEADLAERVDLLQRCVDERLKKG